MSLVKGYRTTDTCRTATGEMYMQRPLPRHTVATACYGEEPKCTGTVMCFAEKLSMMILLFPDTFCVTKM